MQILYVFVKSWAIKHSVKFEVFDMLMENRGSNNDLLTSEIYNEPTKYSFV